MKVYVAIIEDRHTDVEVEVFTSAEAAWKFAKSRAQALLRRAEYFRGEHTPGWLDDSVRVVEKILDGEEDDELDA